MRITLFVSLLLVLLACAEDGGKGPFGGSSGESGDCCKIFVTNGTTAANAGLAGFDAICANDANNPGDGEYLALIAVTGSRVACTTASCSGGASENVNWVLQPNTQYKRTDDAVIGTTTATGIFTFPLENSFGFDLNIYPWTGLTADWRVGDNCNNWSSNSNLVQGVIAYDGGTTFWAINNPPAVNCNNASYAICVQQPR